MVSQCFSYDTGRAQVVSGFGEELPSPRADLGSTTPTWPTSSSTAATCDLKES